MAPSSNKLADMTDSRRRFMQAISSSNHESTPEMDLSNVQQESLSPDAFNLSDMASALSSHAQQRTVAKEGEAVRNQISHNLSAVTSADLDVDSQRMPPGRSGEQGIPASLLQSFENTLRDVLATSSGYRSVDFDVLLKTPTSSLSPEMQQVKQKLAEEAGKLTFHKATAPSSADLKEIKRHINEALKSYGEAEFPFAELTVFRDPTAPTGHSVLLSREAQAGLTDLSERRPKLRELIQDLVGVYIRTANVAGVPFKHSIVHPQSTRVKLPADTHPATDKLLINRTLLAQGEPEFDFDDITAYVGSNLPDGKMCIGGNATAQLVDLAKRKPHVYSLVWDLIQGYMDKGVKIQGFFKPNYRYCAASRSK